MRPSKTKASASRASPRRNKSKQKSTEETSEEKKFKSGDIVWTEYPRHQKKHLAIVSEVYSSGRVGKLWMTEKLIKSWLAEEIGFSFINDNICTEPRGYSSGLKFRLEIIHY